MNLEEVTTLTFRNFEFFQNCHPLLLIRELIFWGLLRETSLKKNSIETVPSIVSIHKACRANINTFQLGGWIKYEIWQFQFSYISCILEFNIYWYAFRKFHRFVFLDSWFKVVYKSINCNIAQYNVVQLKMLFMQYQYQCVVLTAHAL